MSLRRYLCDERGQAAVEFALVVIPFSILLFGIINLGIVLYAYTQMHNATEAAARCFAISMSNTSYANPNCNSITAAQNYALAQYKGPGVLVNANPFIASTSGNCYVNTSGNYAGYQVTGTGSYKLNAVLVNFTIPLSTQACFP
jgi:Flp pilus assembly protein TadG